MKAVSVDCSQKSFSERDLAAITGVSKQTIQKKAKRESWPYIWGDGNGGKIKLYRLGSLPIEYQARIAKLRIAQAAAAIGGPDSPELAGYTAARNYLEDLQQEADEKRLIKERGLAAFAELPEPRKRSAEACFEILQMKDAFIAAGGFRSAQGIRFFCNAVNDGRVALPDKVVEAAGLTGKLHPSTLYRWLEKYETLGMVGLAKDYGKNRGRTLLPAAMQDFVKAMIVEHPRVSLPKLVAGLTARAATAGWKAEVPAPHVVYHFANRWRYENRVNLLSLHDPDAAKSKHAFGAGCASANVLRLNQLWESDATPGDIMLTEGRHTVIGMIDVWSRRPKVLVVPSSKAVAIATLLRHCLLDWGVPEVLRTDNGSDFTARHMERVLDALEIEHDLCAPFTPEQKPHIERFFGTFSHGIVELLPGYIGHDVAERKAIEARKSFADRLMKKGAIVEVKLSARQFQSICDRWIDAVYMQNAHDGLQGKTPAELVRFWTEPVRMITEIRALDVLLSPAPKDNGFRTIKKKGVEADRRFYFNTAMAAYADERVRVLTDPADLGSVYVFLESGEFLCVATCPEWYGISAADQATVLKTKQKEVQAAQRKEYRKLIREQKIALVPEEILRYRESLIANVAELPQKTENYTTPALEEAAIAADKRDGVTNKEALAGSIELPPEVIEYEERQEKVVNLAAKRRERLLLDNDMDIYCWILDRIKDGTVTALQKQWKKEYEAWQDGNMKRPRPFTTRIGVAELLGEGEAVNSNQ